MILDIGPLRRHRNYRLLFIGQLVSFLGSMVSYVAVPVQVQALTQSQAIVGLLSGVQLVPLFVFGLWGGSVADALDRRRLMIVSEVVMCLGAVGLALNASLPRPSVAAVFAISFVMQAANAFHRPAMDALGQKLVTVPELPAASALGSLRGSVGAVAGPALGGWLVSSGGAFTGYAFDAATFAVAVLCMWQMRDLPPTEGETEAGWGSIVEGLRYARTRPELVGTYVVDMVAMAFAFPIALYPSMSEGWGGADAAGYLFSAMPAGALVISIFSGRAKNLRRQGAAVVCAAALWGAFIVGFGLSPSLWWALGFLVLAGAADAVSGIYRMTIWNQTIPNTLRGRLAGVEMISYLSGPLLGNARAGAIAEATSNMLSVVSGGIICVVAVAACAFLLPAFWRYERPEAGESEAVVAG
jgi:MFS family permease